MVIAQIETAGGVEHVDAIAAVDGIDALWIGQYDLIDFARHPGPVRPPDSSRKPPAGSLDACRRTARLPCWAPATRVVRARPGRRLPHARLPGGYLDLPAGAEAGMAPSARPCRTAASTTMRALDRPPGRATALGPSG